MSEEETTAVVRRYLDELAADSPAEPIVRALIDRAVRRLHLLCATPRHRSYPHLTHPPLNLRADDGLAPWRNGCSRPYVREARPRTARQFLALANQHMRREPNDPARRLDDQPAAAELCQRLVRSRVSGGSGPTPDGDVGRTMAGSTDRVRLISQ
jgi:RNA polymerase sigma-70 factor (ECF subfamily)